MADRIAPLFIRADGGSAIGSGHLMRCLALAQCWQDIGGYGSFLSSCDSPSLCKRIESTGFTFHRLPAMHPSPGDLAVTLQVLAQSRARVAPAWVVLDGYHFDTEYQEAIRAAGPRTLVIDDYGHLARYSADILLNQNIGGGPHPYACNLDVVQLIGPRYALLRFEFRAWCGWQREIPPAPRNVLVTMGGADPDNVTCSVLRALNALSMAGLHVKVVLGGANPHLAAVRQLVAQIPGEYDVLVDVTEMPSLMAWADLAISAGGSTCWELCYMGVPTIVLVIAENQRRIATNLGAAGAMVFGGDGQAVTVAKLGDCLASCWAQDTRHRLSTQCRELVDGLGTARISAAMVAICQGSWPDDARSRAIERGM